MLCLRLPLLAATVPCCVMLRTCTSHTRRHRHLSSTHVSAHEIHATHRRAQSHISAIWGSQRRLSHQPGSSRASSCLVRVCVCVGVWCAGAGGGALSATAVCADSACTWRLAHASPCACSSVCSSVCSRPRSLPKACYVVHPRGLGLGLAQGMLRRPPSSSRRLMRHAVHACARSGSRLMRHAAHACARSGSRRHARLHLAPGSIARAAIRVVCEGDARVGPRCPWMPYALSFFFFFCLRRAVGGLVVGLALSRRHRPRRSLAASWRPSWRPPWPPWPPRPPPPPPPPSSPSSPSSSWPARRRPRRAAPP